jgi:hypothetical protein
MAPVALCIKNNITTSVHSLGSLASQEKFVFKPRFANPGAKAQFLFNFSRKLKVCLAIAGDANKANTAVVKKMHMILFLSLVGGLHFSGITPRRIDPRFFTSTKMLCLAITNQYQSQHIRMIRS